jgi:spermidine synthase
VDEHIYHEFIVHPAMAIAPSRRKVLVLGGGDGLAVREILKYPEVESITLVDIDPEMTDIARENPDISRLNQGSLKNDRLAVVENHALVEKGTEEVVLPDNMRFNSPRRKTVATVYTVNLDAKKFVEQISGVYDVIIIDFPDPNNIELGKLYSLGFYRKIFTKLSEYGIMIQQSTSPVHAREAFLCIGRTMDEAGLAVVPLHRNVPTFGEWGWWIGGRDSAYSPARIKRALADSGPIAVPTRYLDADVLRAGLVFGKGSFETVNDDVNTILNNSVYKYYYDAVEAMN